MAKNVLKQLKEQEKAAQNENKQRMMLVAIGILFLIAVMTGLIWAYTTTVEKERQAYTEQGIQAIATGSYQDAVAYLREASEQGEFVASEFLGWLYTVGGHYEDAYKYSAHAAELLYPGSFEVLADLALLGYGPSTGTAVAIALMDQGSQYVAIDRAQAIYEQQQGGFSFFSSKPDYANDPNVKQSAKEIFSEMVERGIPLIEKEADYADFLIRAQKRGASDLELRFGDMMFIGNERLTSNAESAINYWQAAVFSRNSNVSFPALTRLAGSAWHGYAGQRDPQQAVELYNQAARAKDPVALYALGLISLRHPKANAATESAALNFFSQAAALGYGPASTALGVLALTEGGNDDLALLRGAQWLRIAAEDQEDISGRMFYDLMYMSGTGVSKDFRKGFDDMVLVSEVFPPAKNVLLLLQKRIDPSEVLHQALVLANQVLRGEIAYAEGDPVAPKELIDPSTNKPIERPFTFYTPIAKMDPQLRARFGEKNFAPVSKFDLLTVEGKPLLSEDLAKLIIQYAPSTGALRFDGKRYMPRPLQPSVPRHYSIGTFAPFPTLLEKTPFLDETGQESRLF